MTVWRYTAVPVGGKPSTRRRGELAGDTASDVRAALRRIGLQVIDVRPVGDRNRWRASEGALGRLLFLWMSHMRVRRRSQVGELYDSLATMLEAGVPMLEALSTIAGESTRRLSGRRTMLLGIRTSLHEGRSLADSMSAHPAWFDGTEASMVAAGLQSGELAGVLRTLAERHDRSGELAERLAGALAYPAVVSAVGIGVVVFLSSKTLPDLISILDGAAIEVPTLTLGVMALGNALVRFGPGIIMVCAALVVGLLMLGSRLAPGLLARMFWLRRLLPGVLRQAAVAEASLGLAVMIRSGVPAVESLRVLAPTVGGLGTGGLRALLLEAATRIEHGETLSSALDDEYWFNPEFRRLIEIGESSGELPEVLHRVGQRQRRAARRRVDRLASALEPTVILALATLVGIVVLSAVLPLIRLQEILG